MAGMGPPPKHPSERRRRNAPVANLTQLPAEGRSGEAPAWPLPDARDAELEVWGELWVTPQAVAWERLGWSRTVARYCRVLVDAERAGAPVALQAEARQLEDRLGLSPMSMLRLRWEISRDEVGEKREPAGKVEVRRLHAVDASG